MDHIEIVETRFANLGSLIERLKARLDQIRDGSMTPDAAELSRALICLRHMADLIQGDFDSAGVRLMTRKFTVLSNAITALDRVIPQRGAAGELENIRHELDGLLAHDVGELLSQLEGATKKDSNFNEAQTKDTIAVFENVLQIESLQRKEYEDYIEQRGGGAATPTPALIEIQGKLRMAKEWTALPEAALNMLKTQQILASGTLSASDIDAFVSGCARLREKVVSLQKKADEVAVTFSTAGEDAKKSYAMVKLVELNESVVGRMGDTKEQWAVCILDCLKEILELHHNTADVVLAIKDSIKKDWGLTPLPITIEVAMSKIDQGADGPSRLDFKKLEL